ncbi:hypothetical protein Tco_0918895 [Tanacetum coccineum]
MSSITIQQAKLDLELVPNEKRLEIGKCNGRLNPGKIQREPTFQVILDMPLVLRGNSPGGEDFDALLTDEETVSFLRDLGHTREINSLNDVTTGLDKLRLSKAQILWGMYHQKSVDYVELLWEDFIYQIDNKAYKKQEKMYYPRFTKVIIHYFLTQDKTVSWRNKIGMHTSRDDYLINTPRFISAKEVTQIYGVVLPESLTSPEMKKTKAYKTYLGFAIGATPYKKARKFKKPVSPQLTTVPVSSEEPTGKSKRVKRPAKKSTKAPARGVVIRETPEMPSQKSLRDFHKTHPSGSGTVSKTAPSATKIKHSVTNEGTGVKAGFPDVTEEESSESEAESWENDEDDNNNEQDSSGEDSDQENDSDDDKTQSDNENELDSEHEIDENKSGSESHQKENEKDIGDDEQEVKEEFVKTLSNDFDDEDEEKITDKAKEEDTNAEITNVQQGNEHPEISQVIEDAHVTLSTVPRKTEVPVTSSSHSSDLASKFLIFLEIHHTDAEIISPMDVHVHHEVPSQQTPTLLTVPVSVITESSPIFNTVILQSLPSFTLPPQQSTSIPPPTTEATNP